MKKLTMVRMEAVIACPKPVKTKKKKVKKELSETQRRIIEKKLVKKLTKDLKHLCSLICRKMWGEKCAMCGREGTAAHHFFGWKACTMLRFTIENLVWLCFGCHIGKVHQQGLTEPVRTKLIDRIGQERFDEMYSIAFKPKEWTSDELRRVYNELDEMLRILHEDEMRKF